MWWKREKAEAEKGHAWEMCWYILNAIGPCRPLIKQYSDLFLFLESCPVPPVGLWCPEVIGKELGQAITKARQQWRVASLLVRESERTGQLLWFIDLDRKEYLKGILRHDWGHWLFAYTTSSLSIKSYLL